MEDQFLRRRKKDGLDEGEVKILIDKHQEKLIFLVEIDPNESVIFQEKQGRLATEYIRKGYLVTRDKKRIIQ